MMTRDDMRQRRRRRSASSGRTLTLVLVACAGTGCRPDHRISLAEFLATQQPAPSESTPTDSAPALDLGKHLGPYRVGSGDVLFVTLTRADQTGLFPPLQARVDRKGEIDLPIIGGVRIGDLELEDAEDAIRNAYIPAVLTEGVVHIELATPDTTNVLVTGAVTTPGLIPLRRTERNPLFAIVGAGGVSSLASGEATVRRLRQPGSPEVVKLTDPESIRQALDAQPLENGDIVYVHAAQPNTVFVGGLVTRTSPQSYPYGTSVSVLQAIAAAGGLRTDVFPKEGTLIRRTPEGRDIQVRLDLNRLASGRDPNFALQAGDILWVPETLETRIQDFINRNIYLRAGVSVNYSVSGIEFMNRRGQRGGVNSANLQDSFDPFGFLNQNTALQGLTAQPATP